MENNHFDQFDLHPVMGKVVDQLKFKNPTEIQKRVIPSVLKGKSVIGQSHTGSGKTHAFLLPLLSKMNDNVQEVQIVITTPTRELATQIYDEVKKIIQFAGREDNWKAKLLVGGTDKERMMEKLKEPPHIVVGTPGRILDMVTNGALSVYSAQSFVIDEADLMLDLGFIQDVDKLLVRSQEDIQLLVFSATIPQRLEHFLKKYLKQPVHVKIKGGVSPNAMEHRLIANRHRDAATIITDLSKVIQPYLAIIFTNGKQFADDLYDKLLQNGLNVGLIHGGLTPRERKRALKDIKALKYQYIVATDLASRGIDIKGVSHVINAQLPKEVDFYTHRVGRTARAGLEGTAVSIYEDSDLSLVQKLEKHGLTFAFYDVKNGQWQQVKAWNERKRRTDVETNVEKEAWKRVRKNKKVKPGYKRKMKQEQQSIKRQLQRKKNHRK